MLCLCGLPGGEAINRSDLLRGSGSGSDRQRGCNNKIVERKNVVATHCCVVATAFWWCAT